MATLPYELAPKEFSGQEEDQQRSKHATSRSVNVKKSLLVKQKSSVVNARKPPIEKRRKPSASNVQFVCLQDWLRAQGTFSFNCRK